MPDPKAPSRPTALAPVEVDGIKVFSYAPLLPTDMCTPHPDNPNQGDVGALTELIRTHGFRGEVEVQASTGRIVAGENRWRAARDLGMQNVPQSWIDMTDEEALRRCISDNRARDLALYDEVRLRDVMVGLATSDAGLEGTAWDGDDLDDFIAAMDGETKTRRALDTASKLGQLTYRIVLICRDEAHQAELFERFKGEGLNVSVSTV